MEIIVEVTDQVHAQVEYIREDVPIEVALLSVFKAGPIALTNVEFIAAVDKAEMPALTNAESDSLVYLLVVDQGHKGAIRELTKREFRESDNQSVKSKKAYQRFYEKSLRK
ncbi:MAG TPA: hypothetical protein VLH19_02690 [Patescibacteria group bacterium]|nr:hypothetical protein [Patescibacteria group bacterium]